MAGWDPNGMITTILLGIGGGLVGGFLGRMPKWYGESKLVGLGLAVLGAILVVFLYRTLSDRPKLEGKDASPETAEGVPSFVGLVSQTERPFRVEKEGGVP